MKINKIKLLIYILVIVSFAGFIAYYTLKSNVDSDYFNSKLMEIKNSFNANDFETAILNSNKLVEEATNDDQKIQALLSLATVYVQKGSIEYEESEYANKAISIANEVLELDEKNSEAFRLIGYSYEIMEKYPEAISYYTKSIELDSKRADTLSNLAHVYDLTGDIDKAEELYLKAVDLDKTLDHALYNLSSIYLRKNDIDKARFYANETINFSKNNRFRAEAFDLLGLISYEESDFEMASQNFQSAIDMDSSYVNAYVHLGDMKISELSEKLLSEGGDTFSKDFESTLEQASLLIDVAIDINPNYTEAYIVKSKISAAKNNLDEAIENLNKAKSVLPNDISLGFNQKKATEKNINMRIEIFTSDIDLIRN